MNNLRNDGRAFNEVRPLALIYDAFGFADASVLLSLGKTKVLVSVMMHNGVPPFLKGKGVGWLTAEYAMLPAATRIRGTRSSSLSQPNSRSVEISRLVGRSLRSVVDLSNFGERTITIDCDVLQADGGTRAACITAASFALRCAMDRWMKAGSIKEEFIKENLGAISVGIVDGELFLDLAQDEDNKAEADFNFVLTASGKIVEIQGTAEKNPMDWELFEQARLLAMEGVNNLFVASKKIIVPHRDLPKMEMPAEKRGAQKNNPMFALGNRPGGVL